REDKAVSVARSSAPPEVRPTGGTRVDLGGVVWKYPLSVSSSTGVEVKRSGSDAWAPEQEAMLGSEV
ncbi:hypothetical protein Tco_1170779, partial [Tanacetum coccineum]